MYSLVINRILGANIKNESHSCISGRIFNKYRCKHHNLIKLQSVSSSNKVINNNDDGKDGKNDDNVNAKSSEKFKFDDATSHVIPTNATDEDFPKRFWEAYEKKVKKLNTDQTFPDKLIYRNPYNESPLQRAYNILKDDILTFFAKLKYKSDMSLNDPSNIKKKNYSIDKPIFPGSCDILIIGGGIVGTSIAYNLQERTKAGLEVVVVEKDMSYSKASTVLSIGGIRQQFSTPENIMLSKYGMDFLQDASQALRVEGEPPPRVPVTFNGYLTLASEEGFPQLMENFHVQREANSFVQLHSKDQLKKKFPWINIDGVEGGVYGVQREGWIDPWIYLLALNRKTKEQGVKYVNGTVIRTSLTEIESRIGDVETDIHVQRLHEVEVELPDGEIRPIKCAICIIAAGCWSQEVGKICGVGAADKGIRAVPIPVEPRKRFVYCVKSPKGPGLSCPLVIDPSGVYFRREGLADMYLCGQSPHSEEEPNTENLDVDYQFFEDRVWPQLSQRCSSFETLKLHSSWAGYYDHNTFDQNAIIGRHPDYSNLYIATGYSGHGIQHAAGTGKALTEYIIDGEYETINVERLGFERILQDRQLIEKNIY